MSESWVPLTEADKARMAEQMASHWTVVEGLREKKANDAKRTQGEIDEQLEEIGRIARIVNAQGENQDQMSLFAPDEAKAALSQLYARQPDCTPVNARECPRHGVCSCERAAGDEVGNEAPEVKSPDCVLHGVSAPHSTEPKPEEPAELTEPQIVEAMAREAVEEWARLGKTPESVKERNARVKEAVSAQSIPVHRRKPFAEAVKRLLSDVPSTPVSVGEAPPEVDGNVAEEAASA